MSNMDPFKAFEFKPLTEGLGFHKKAVSLKEGLKSTGVLEDELQDVPLSMPKNLLMDEPKGPGKKHSFEDVLSALEKTPIARAKADLQFTEPLPRERAQKRAMELDISTPAPIRSPFPRPDAYKTPVNLPPFVEKVGEKVGEKPAAEKIGTRRGAADSPQRKWLPAAVSFPSAALDGIIVTAMGLVFLIALLAVTKVDLSVVTRNLHRDTMTQISLGLLFVAVMQMYVVISRSFFGRTLGEWTFDVQLGLEDEQKKETYPLRVAFRSLIVTLSGLVFLPLLSAALGRDVAGHVSGVQLYRQRI
jgi:hypothetical protein